MENCKHDMIYGGLCAVCGQDISNTKKNQNNYVNYGHQHLTISFNEAKRIDFKAKEELLFQKKLFLILDLDHTIVHATFFNQNMKLKNIQVNEILKGIFQLDKEIFEFELFRQPLKYLVKLRYNIFIYKE